MKASKVELTFKGITVLFYLTGQDELFAEAKPFLVNVLDVQASYVPKFVENNVWSENRSLQTMGQKGRSRWFVNEAGLYQLIFASKTDVAREVQQWVFSEVLPTIRKEGAYISPDISEQQAHAAKEKLDRILDLPNPWERMWSQTSIAKIKKLYGGWTAKTFWWKWIYAFLTVTERYKLDTENPIDPTTKERRLTIHEYLEPETKARLAEYIRFVSMGLAMAETKEQLENGLRSLLAEEQIPLDLH